MHYKQRALTVVDLVRLVVRRFGEDRCTQIAGSLTFTTLLSLVPLITVAVAIFSAFPAFSDLLDHLRMFLLKNMVPGAAEKIITVYMPKFSANAGKLTTVGMVFLGITSLMLMYTIARAFNSIWRVTQPRRWVQSALVYWAVLTIGPLLIGGSVSLTSWLVALSVHYGGEAYIPHRVLWRIAGILLTSTAYGLIYLMVPNRYVSKRDAVVGGLVAGIGFEVMKWGFGLYVSKIPTYTMVYGAFAVLPLFLLWIYLSWTVLLIGAVTTAVLPEWRLGAYHSLSYRGDQFTYALQLLEALWRAQHGGRPLRLPQLHNAARTGQDRVERILREMERSGWVNMTVGGYWMLSRNPQEIRIIDVYRLLVFDPPSTAKHVAQGDARIGGLLDTTTQRLDEVMDMTLEAFFASRVQESPAPDVGVNEEHVRRIGIPGNEN